MMYFFICFSVLLISATCSGKSTSKADRSPICTLRNMYKKVDGMCDSYIECRDYRPIEMQCPDGLHYNLNAQWPDYPCGYPQDVRCAGRGISQPAMPTAECNHQYGYFPSPLAQANDCGRYRICIAGKASEMFCPTGLAFNPVTARCDWPDLVPTCNVDEYLGHKCPPASVDEKGNPVITNHRYESNCYVFYSCMNGHARVLSCDNGYAFNAVTGRCENAEFVKCDISQTIAVPK